MGNRRVKFTGIGNEVGNDDLAGKLCEEKETECRRVKLAELGSVYGRIRVPSSSGCQLLRRKLHSRGGIVAPMLPI